MSVTQIHGGKQIKDLTILNASINGSAAIAYSKLNLSTSILNADISASAAIAFNKLADLTDGDILIGNVSDEATAVTPSGDIAVSNAGAFTIKSGVIVNDDINASAAIAYSKLDLTSAILNADLAGSITTANLADGAEFVQRDGSVAFTSDQPMGSNKLTGLSNGTSGSDAVNLNQLNAQTNDLDRKNGVDLVEIVNLSLTGEQTIDGTLTSASRVLLVGQTDKAQNGIYTTDAGAWSRTSDADAPSEVTLGLMTTVEGGSARAGTVWLLTTVNATPTVIDTTELTITELPSELVTASGFLDKTSGDITLKNLTNGQMLVGNGSGVAVSVTIGGDISISNDGTGAIASDVIINADVKSDAAIAYSKLNLATSILNTDINASAAIDFSKLATLTSGNLLIGSSGGNVATSVAMQGDATIVADGTITIDASFLKAADIVTREVPTGSINSSNTSYSLAATPTAGTESVYLNGVLQNEGAGNDYTISGATITYLTAPDTGDILLVSYFK